MRAESEFVEQFKFSGGIVVAIDFDDGVSIAELATDGPFVVHGLLRDEARVVAARQAIQQAGVYGKVSCDGYNGRDLPYVPALPYEPFDFVSGHLLIRGECTCRLRPLRADVFDHPAALGLGYRDGAGACRYAAEAELVDLLP